MDKDLKTRLMETMHRRGIKIPAFSKQSGIPKDRIYKWFQQGTQPKAEDSLLIEKWINREKANEETAAEEEFQTNKKLLPERILIDVMLLEIAKLKSKVFGIAVDDAIDELEKNAQLLLRQIERS